MRLHRLCYISLWHFERLRNKYDDLRVNEYNFYQELRKSAESGAFSYIQASSYELFTMTTNVASPSRRTFSNTVIIIISSSSSSSSSRNVTVTVEIASICVVYAALLLLCLLPLTHMHVVSICPTRRYIPALQLFHSSAQSSVGLSVFHINQHSSLRLCISIIRTAQRIAAISAILYIVIV